MIASSKTKEKASDTAKRSDNTSRKSPNLTGIPDTTKQRFENLSGLSFDDVRVHYNSSKPAQLQALAYTQGVNVYIASGQEQHLPHELGHVIQQKQERVTPTDTVNGIDINNSVDLEQNADNIAFGNNVSLQSFDPSNQVVQMRKISEFSQSELALYQPLLWSEARFADFLQRYKDADVGEQFFDIRANIQRLIHEPEITHRLETTGSFTSPLPKESYNLQVASSNQTLNHIWDDEKSHLSHFNLGFNSAAVFRKNDDGYVLLDSFKTNRTGGKEDWKKDTPTDPFLLKRKLSSVATTGVSSCTFIAMTDDEETFLVVMHLDSYDIPPIELIKDLVQTVTMKKVFISKIQESEEDAKAKLIQETFGTARGAFPPKIDQTTILDRGPSDFQKVEGHEQIGVTFSSEGMKILGTQGNIILQPSDEELDGMLASSESEYAFLSRLNKRCPGLYEVENKLSGSTDWRKFVKDPKNRNFYISVLTSQKPGPLLKKPPKLQDDWERFDRALSDFSSETAFFQWLSATYTGAFNVPGQHIEVGPWDTIRSTPALRHQFMTKLFEYATFPTAFSKIWF